MTDETTMTLDEMRQAVAAADKENLLEFQTKANDFLTQLHALVGTTSTVAPSPALQYFMRASSNLTMLLTIDLSSVLSQYGVSDVITPAAS